MRRRAALIVLAILAAGVPVQIAKADGDPGSDVLVYQPLFLAADASVSVAQQAQLGGLLRQARDAGFPIRVALIASRSDLGAVTGLWRNPRAYARFLGLELSLAYTGRLLVVMPNGFGFNWPGHSATAAYRTLSPITIRRNANLADAANTAVVSLAAAAGVKLTPASPSIPSGPPVSQPGSAPAAPPASGSSIDAAVAAVTAALAIAGALVLLARRLLPLWRMRRRSRERATRRGRAVALAGGVAAAAGVAAVLALALIGSPGTAPSEALARNPNLDPGTPLNRPAPPFTLTDQFGQPVSLDSLRGKVVLLAFNDSECTTICPLTTAAMLAAKAKLGAAGSRVQLLGIDANPKATSLEDVLSYSQLHGMLHAWHFLTGSLPQLERVWKAYGVEAAIQGGQIAHTPALFVIDPQGRLAKLYVTQQSYAAIDQLGQLLAREASRLLPDHPPVGSNLDYTTDHRDHPRQHRDAPARRRRDARLGPGDPGSTCSSPPGTGRSPASPASSTRSTGTRARLARRRLPALTAVDEQTVEPSRATLTRFLATLSRPLAYPVAVDSSGRVADGYEVQGQPWFVLTSPTGQILWYWQVATSGWLSPASLIAHRARRAGKSARGTGQRRNRPTAARRLSRPARRAAPTGQPAARLRSGPHRPRQGATRLPGSDKRLGVMVRAVPLGVRPVRRRRRPLRTPGRVPRRRHRRLSRRRPGVPGPAPGQLSELPDQPQRPRPPRPAGPRRPTHHHLPQPRRQGHLHPHRPIPVARHARRRHPKLCAQTVTGGSEPDLVW